MPAHIVIVEDDPTTRRRLSAYLSANGYRVTEAADADTMEQIIDTDPPELLIVDINLDGHKDGLTITREQRAMSQVGIILLTSRDDQVDRIVGLEMGADDYITKPFDKRELLARVKNLLTRIAAIGQAPDGPAPLSDFGRWRFDRIRRRLVSAQGVVPLTRSEFDLLHALTVRPGITLSRARLFEAIGQPNAGPENRNVDVLVGRLRRKIETNPAAPDWLLTVHG